MKSRPSPEQLRHQVEAFLSEELGIHADDIELDTALVSSGLIDSMSLVQLATHIERTLDIEIPDQDITVENLDSLAKILAYIESRLSS